MSPNAPDPIRVLIADGDPLVGRALERLLAEVALVEVVGTAADSPAALALAVQLRPAVALVDVRSAELDGLALTRSLRREIPAMQVVVLSVYAGFCDQALDAGACRFVLKDCGREDLVAAIELASRGQYQARPRAR